MQEEQIASQKNGKSTMLDDLKAKRHKTTGIIAERIKGDVTRASAKQYGVAFDDDWDDEQVAVALYAFFWKKKQQGAEMFTCDYKIGGCGGGLINESGPCPFCGFEEDEEDSESVEAATSADLAESNPEDDSDDAPVSRPQPIETNEVEEETEIATAPTAPRAKTPKGRSAVKPAKPPKAVEGTEPMAVAGSSTGLAKVVESKMVVKDDTTPASKVQTAHTLDAAVAQFKEAQKNAFVAWWHEGRSLWTIFSEKLWTLRIDKATKAPAYKTFHQFVETEIGITPNLVFKKMDAARAYTELQAAKLGMTKCVLLMQAPEEVRVEIEAKIHKGEIKSTKDTRAAVSKGNKEKGSVKSKGSKTGERKVGGGRKKEFAKIAIADQLGKSTLAFYMLQDDDGKGQKVEEVPPAVEKWLAKVQPWAVNESLDGEVSERFTVLVKDGKLKLHIDRTRAEDDAE